MPAFSASAPGKVILFGEHAVVYQRPAIAVPVTQVIAKAVVRADLRGKPGQVHIEAPDIQLERDLNDLPVNHPFHLLLSQIQQKFGIDRFPAFHLRVTSSIPIAAGMGSGAAISVASARAITAFLGKVLSEEETSALAYEVEKVFHGTPSGIDNTVIAYAQPVFFQRGQPIQFLKVNQPFTLVIGHSGVQSPTSDVVAAVCRAWQVDTQSYEGIFDKIGQLVHKARRAIEEGPMDTLGQLMLENHNLLREIRVSSVDLDRLVDAAMQSGALGAKLSGAGRGGNMIALAAFEDSDRIATALHEAGAVRTIVTHILPHQR